MVFCPRVNGSSSRRQPCVAASIAASTINPHRLNASPPGHDPGGPWRAVRAKLVL